MATLALATTLSLLALTLAFAVTASADPITVGDCRKFSGACAGVCVDHVANCPRESDFACVGFSYQVPQCVPDRLFELP